MNMPRELNMTGKWKLSSGKQFSWKMGYPVLRAL